MRSSLALILALAASPLAAQSSPNTPTTVKITVDSVRHNVVIVAGPFDLVGHGNMPGMGSGVMHHTSESKMMRFAWPVAGALNGVNVTLTDPHGAPVPGNVIHHLVMYNFDRRQLIHESDRAPVRVGTGHAGDHAPGRRRRAAPARRPPRLPHRVAQ